MVTINLQFGNKSVKWLTLGKIKAIIYVTEVVYGIFCIG